MIAGIVKQFPPIRRLIEQRDQLRRQQARLLGERYVLRTSLASMQDRIARLADAMAAQGYPVSDTDTTAPAPAYSYLFIVTYGRSGSTLLQGILNAIPGYRIRGENRQIMQNLYEFEVNAMIAKRTMAVNLERPLFEVESEQFVLPGLPSPDEFTRPAESSPTHPFYGFEGYDPARAREIFGQLIRETVLRPEPADRVLGFKEIRWPMRGLLEYLEFIRSVFPGARFIMNTRELGDVSKSKWWADDARASFERLQNFEREMLAACESLGEAAIHVRYEEWSRGTRGLARLFEWLGEELDADVIGSVLDVRHSY